MRYLTLLSFLFLISSCSVRYTETEFSTDVEFGYNVTVLTPSADVIGDCIYLSDSNTTLEVPTEWMKEKLRTGYRVLIPTPWGNPGRSRATLDNFSNRLRGVSYSLEKLRVNSDSTHLLEVFAEGFYTPIGLRIARDFKANNLILVQPIATNLHQELVWQFQENRDTATHSLVSLWNIREDSTRTLFTSIVNSNNLAADQFFGVHWTNFIRSYWTELYVVNNYEALQEECSITVLISPSHPFYSQANAQAWKNRKAFILPWNEKLKAYSISNVESILLKQ